MSRQFSRAGFFPTGARAPNMANTLSESGDRSPRGYGYISTGTKNQQGAQDMVLVAQGPGDNTAQTAQAYKSFMDMRSSKLIVE